MYVNLRKVDAFAKRQRYVWTDEIEDGVRHIYIRCYNEDCRKIFRVGNKNGSVIAPLVIDDYGTFSTCLICPTCEEHLFVTLDGYEEMKGVKTVFGHK